MLPTMLPAVSALHVFFCVGCFSNKKALTSVKSFSLKHTLHSYLQMLCITWLVIDPLYAMGMSTSTRDLDQKQCNPDHSWASWVFVGFIVYSKNEYFYQQSKCCITKQDRKV